MIVQMKKTAIIVRQQDAVETIKHVRSLGALHVENQQLPQGKDISALQEDLALLNSCLDVFTQAEALPEDSKAATQSLVDGRLTVKHVIDLWKRYDQLESFSRGIINGISEWERWGDFNPQEIQGLSEKGIFVRLYQIPISQMEELPDEVAVKKIFTATGTVYCAVISREKSGIPFKEIILPKQGLSAMQKRLSEDKKAMGSIRNEIKKVARSYPQLLEIKKTLEKEIEFQQALCGMGKQGVLSYLTGYIPFDKVDTLINCAHQQGWGVSVSDPSEEDEVPTLIRNPKWVSIIAPVFKILEIVPGYRELDISLLFLIFFSLFFGILIGDAGYGLVYFLLTFWMHKKFGKMHAVSKDFFLFYVLSLCAIIWGLLTGSFFGQEWIAKAGLKPLVPALNNTQNIQSLCFFIGALHLTIAHSWRAILKFPSLTALSDIGWVFVLWAAFFFAKLLILSQPLPSYGMWFFIIGVTLVMFFTNPQKNILKTIGEGLSALALSLMNNFTDVVSYVRLFAVGLAGVAIADTFNNMAAGIGTGNIFAIIASCFIVVAGHSLNLILGPMSVLVHGVRLNVLEFSGHANVTWSGFGYKPLK